MIIDFLPLGVSCHRGIRRRSGLGLLLLLLILSPLQLACASQATRVLVLGDSISAAYGMSLEQGWVALAEAELAQEGRPVAMINASISGETTAGGLRRLPALLAAHQPQVVIIELGGNDGLRGFPVSRLRDNLRAMVNLATEAGARVLLLPMEIPPNYGSRYTSAFRDSFSLVAQETGALLTGFLLDGIATRGELMQADGIHPTREAQTLIVANLLPHLLTLLPS